MKLSLCLLLVFLVSVSAESVVDLTVQTFDSVIAENDFVLVEFFAPWCGHCKHLAPEYEKAATQLKSDGSSIVLAKVDATVEAALGERFQIRGYPTLKFFRRGSPVDYNGPRTAEGLVAWVVKKSGPVTVVLESEEAYNEFVAEPGTRVVAFVGDNAQAQQVFAEVASDARLDEFGFGEVRDASLAKQVGGSPVSVKLARKFDDDVVFSEELEKDELAGWILQNAFPYVDDAPAAWGRVSERNLPVALLFADTEEDQFKDILSWLNPLAKKFISKLSVVYVGKSFHSRVQQMGGSGKIPTIVIMSLTSGRNYPFGDDSELSATNVEAFFQGVVDGTLQPFLKSEEIPEENNGPVIVVVGKSFEDIVMDNKKDVLVEFYAPWCGHCKQLTPIYESLGEHFKDSNGIVIAKVDATANDTPVSVKGYPTIYLFPAGVKDSPIEYQGARTLEALTQFVQENASTLNQDATKGHDEL